MYQNMDENMNQDMDRNMSGDMDQNMDRNMSGDMNQDMDQDMSGDMNRDMNQDMNQDMDQNMNRNMSMMMNQNYIRQSLELHLFFARIMKEHAFFLQVSFTPKFNEYSEKADIFRTEFDQLLEDVVQISDGVVGRDVLSSGEVVTPYTMDAEKATVYYTGVLIPVDITAAENELTSRDGASPIPNMGQMVYEINQRAMKLINALIEFKSDVLANVLSCNMFTNNYPQLIEHIIREAEMYLMMTKQLQEGANTDMMNDEVEQEMFWNNIMAEHAKFIRGLLDPTEVDLIKAAENFGIKFDDLNNQLDDAVGQIDAMPQMDMDN